MFSLSLLGTATDNHSAYLVRPGMMNGALHFFHEIKWVEFEGLRVNGDWGQARFVSSNIVGSHIYQLTELTSEDPEKLEMTEFHIAIHFSSATPQEASEAILDWAIHSGASEGATIEPANAEGTKWFICLPALFKFSLEIV